MRDVGILVWVAFLIVGIVGSMVSSLRKQAQQAQQAQQAPRPAVAVPPEWLPPESAARPQTVSKPWPAAAMPAPEAPHAETGARARHGRHRLFAGRQAWVRAVIAAEVLGKPRGLSDEYSPR